MSDELNIPYIGECRDGCVLVCMGDDKPDQWDGWLQKLVQYFNYLSEVAVANGLSCRVKPRGRPLKGWADFCDLLGVCISHDFWEGSMISGHFVTGWIGKKELRFARRSGRALIKQIERNLLDQLRALRIKELKEINDLDTLVLRTQNDREALLVKITSLERSVDLAKAETSRLRAAALALEAARARTESTLRFVTSVVRGASEITRNGPLLRWSDGTIYAITKRGSVGLPEKSPYWSAIQELRSMGYTVIEVTEMTVTGGPSTRPIEAHGAEDETGWDNVWNSPQKTPRKFEVADPSYVQGIETVSLHLNRDLSST